MAEKKKGLAPAIMAAVTTYISEEEAPSTASLKKVQAVNNVWGLAGRQEIMEMRRLWQLRIPRP